MLSNKLIVPVLKWVGGKRQLMPTILNHIPKQFTNYYEPFIGGGAVLFQLQPEKAVINDFNAELINVYQVVKNDVDKLLLSLAKHQNTPAYFYNIRASDRSSDFQNLSAVERASRIIYLNKTCFNGLYRVNSAGQFNAPFGFYKRPNIVNEFKLRAVSDYLNNNDILILNADYETALHDIKKDAFVYFDPPYHPVSETSNFTGYVQGGFDSKEQIRLKNVCDELTRKNIKFLLSNSAVPFITELYAGYEIHIVKANRAINSNGEKRGEVDEVLICNYEY